MLSMDRQTWKWLSRRLRAACWKLPDRLQDVLAVHVRYWILLPRCPGSADLLGCWKPRSRSIVFTGPLLVPLSKRALEALVAHEACHAWFHFFGMKFADEEAAVDDQLERWGIDTSALNREAPLD